MMQKDNGIKISDWKGRNPDDQELNIIGLFLIQMVNQSPEDVRHYLTDYRSFRKKYVWKDRKEQIFHLFFLIGLVLDNIIET